MAPEPFSFAATLARLKEATRTQSDTDLAESLGLRQGSISGAKQKQRIPPGWIVSVAKDFNVSADWLLTGKGSMHTGSEEAADAPVTSHQAAPAACSNCEALQKELREERKLNRELVGENRQLNAENRQLWKENGELRVELAEIKARSAPDQSPSEPARNCA